MKINGLPVECEKCKVECTVKEYRKIHCTPPTILHHKITQVAIACLEGILVVIIISLYFIGKIS